MKRILSCLLAVLLLLSSAALAAVPVRGMPFSEMEYESIDAESVAGEIAALTDMLEELDDPDDAYGLEAQAYQLFSRYDTMYTLSSIHYDMDNSDDYWYGEYSANSVGYAAVDAACDAFHDALEMLEAGEGAWDDDTDYDGLIALYEQESELLAEYSRLLGAGTVEYGGESLSYEGIYAIEDYDAYTEAMNLWLDTYNAPLAELYVQLIGVRNAQAELCGYDSYIDMALETMGYSYNAEMVHALLDEIAEEAVPLFEELVEVGIKYYPEVEMDFDAYAEALSSLLRKLDRSFGRMWDFMLENELIYTQTGPYISPSVYCTYLLDYSEPFIFSPFYGDTYSMSGVLHEFGHAYSDSIIMVPELDTREVFSHGLELLVANHYDEIFPDETAYEMRYDVAANIFINYVAGTEILFELQAYDMENPSVEKLNELFAECDEKFGYYSADMPRETYSRFWITVPQLFETPGYMIAYTVSADAALQLWEISLEDEDRAVELYLDMIYNCEEMSLAENLHSLGLKSAFDEGRAAELTAFCKSVLLDESLYTGEASISPAGMLGLLGKMLF